VWFEGGYGGGCCTWLFARFASCAYCSISLAIVVLFPLAEYGRGEGGVFQLKRRDLLGKMSIRSHVECGVC